MLKHLKSLLNRGKSRGSEWVPQKLRRSPEELCAIDPEQMTREEIKTRLAKLYKRHNHAAGSLDRDLREEADEMLDAIAECREKYVEKLG